MLFQGRDLRGQGAGAVKVGRDIAYIGAKPQSALDPTLPVGAQIVEKLRAVGELGMEYGIFYFPEAAYDRSGIDLFASEVIPALR